MIRKAKFGDIMAMVDLLEAMRAKSIYADRADISRDAVKTMIASAIQRDGHKNSGGSIVLVAEGEGGKLCGMLIGVLERAYYVLDKLMATDLFFFTTDDAVPLDAITMARQFKEWAAGNPLVIEITMGATHVMGDWKPATAIYRRLGLEQSGVIYSMKVSQ
ncbi:MAG: hypothetical protein KDG54_16700 [Geminicoccaceae bacterium]|nr:hypothetical protein [Geminicoccaceae bacterium]